MRVRPAARFVERRVGMGWDVCVSPRRTHRGFAAQKERGGKSVAVAPRDVRDATRSHDYDLVPTE